MQEYKLTQYSHAAGCGCKMAPADLEKILSERSDANFTHLLVGNHSNDDAAVWDLGNGNAVINTVDFFMPIVNDAFDFGRIASANAISDVYAMGGTPLFANAMLGWPMKDLPLELASEVMNGARAICKAAGIPLAGGHSIDSKEPLFGLSVTGNVAVRNLKRNNTPNAGNLLFLTKPLGIGIMGTAIKRGYASEEHAAAAVEVMCTLNKAGAELGKLSAVTALTDVTGFGFLNHLIEMCGSEFSAEIFWKDIPRFPFLKEYLLQNSFPDGTYRNWNACEHKVTGVSDPDIFHVLNDPQTSGGLLVAVDVAYAAEVVQVLKETLGEAPQPIGKITPRGAHVITVHS